jgi:hypothetical protein
MQVWFPVISSVCLANNRSGGWRIVALSGGMAWITVFELRDHLWWLKSLN